MAVGPEDGYDIEPAPLILKVMTAEEVIGRDDEPLLFLRCDKFAGMSAFSRLHLDKDESIFLSRDNIDFTARRAVVGRDHSQAARFQVANSGGFAAVPESLREKRLQESVHANRGEPIDVGQSFPLNEFPDLFQSRGLRRSSRLKAWKP